MLKDLILVFEILSFLFSLLIYRRKVIPHYLRLFPIFLLITSVVEFIGMTTRETSMVAMPIYNYFTILEFMFYFYVLYYLISIRTVKKLIVIAAIIYPTVAMLHILSQDVYYFQALPFMLGAIATVSFCIFHFYELFSLPNLKATVNTPSFWICVGLLLFYGCVAPLLGAWNWLAAESMIKSQVDDLILGVLNYILYSSFAVAFLCFLKITKLKENVVNKLQEHSIGNIEVPNN